MLIESFYDFYEMLLSLEPFSLLPPTLLLSFNHSLFVCTRSLKKTFPVEVFDLLKSISSFESSLFYSFDSSNSIMLYYYLISLITFLQVEIESTKSLLFLRIIFSSLILKEMHVLLKSKSWLPLNRILKFSTKFLFYVHKCLFLSKSKSFS